MTKGVRILGKFFMAIIVTSVTYINRIFYGECGTQMIEVLVYIVKEVHKVIYV